MEKADTLIYGCTVLPMNGKYFIEDGAIAIKDGKIVFVGKASLVTSIKAENRINAKGKVAMPGLINCHTHAPMTLFRGFAEDKPLTVWLREAIWPLEAKLRAEDVYVGALLGCLEMIKSGTTCFADMYFHEEIVARAVEQSRIRAALAQGIIEAGNKELGRKMFRESVGFAKKFNGHADGRITVLLGPHAVYSCSQDLLREVSEKASELGVGVHMHLAESKEILQGVSEVEFLEEIGFFKSCVLAAHCINLTENDMHILSKRGVNVVHVPVANMKLGLGAARIKDLISLGVNVCLGTDGPASNNTLDMFETVKFAALLQKLTYMNPTVLSAYEVLKMATMNGAKALGLADKVGSLEIGKRADLILIDFSKSHLKPLHDVFASLVYSARGSDVDTVIVDGKIIMENRHVKSLDEISIIEEAEKTAADLLAR
ncbi:MAG: amidohydrolase [Candidatus Bathyarchaeota archaeon]|nr:amidohydrolase [Candidatus Bathyarchaeota archaeon]